MRRRIKRVGFAILLAGVLGCGEPLPPGVEPISPFPDYEGYHRSLRDNNVWVHPTTGHRKIKR